MQTLQTAWQHHQQGNLTLAEELYRQVLAVHPTQADALHLLGVVHLQTGRQVEAVEQIEQAIAANGTNPIYYNHLGAAYGALGDTDRAEAAFRSAVRLKPDFAEGHLNLGLLLAGQCRLDEAVESYRRTVELQPQLVLGHNNLGIALAQLGRRAEAMAAYEQALAIDPAFPEAHVNRAYLWLADGDFARGWPEYEWRWRSKGYAPPVHHQRRWEGGEAAGRTILLDAEQGIGDTLQFVRYAQVLKARGARVVLRCQNVLVPLLSRCQGVDAVVGKDDPLPSFDAVAPLMSLPHILGTTLDTIPAEVPYLLANPELVERWELEIRSFHGFRVGVVWQGSKRFQTDRLRSFPLAQIEPLAQVPGVRLFSLQKGPGSEQLSLAHQLFAIKDLGSRLDEVQGAFCDTAAVMSHLHLVIASDTAVAHLAGALGRPVWLALPHTAEWRWLIGRDDSPWYPTMRIFRQGRPGDWETVFARMAEELARLAPTAA